MNTFASFPKPFFGGKRRHGDKRSAVLRLDFSLGRNNDAFAAHWVKFSYNWRLWQCVSVRMFAMSGSQTAIFSPHLWPFLGWWYRLIWNWHRTLVVTASLHFRIVKRVLTVFALHRVDLRCTRCLWLTSTLNHKFRVPRISIEGFWAV